MVDLFLDYTCPYCRRGFSYVEELIEKDSVIASKFELCPIEAHPKDEEPNHRPYADIAVKGGLFIKAKGLDAITYAKEMFKAVSADRNSAEDVNTIVSAAVSAGANADDLTAALSSAEYAEALKAANDYAYNKKKVWAVPTFVAPEKRLDAKEGVGVTADEVADMLL